MKISSWFFVLAAQLANAVELDWSSAATPSASINTPAPTSLPTTTYPAGIPTPPTPAPYELSPTLEEPTAYSSPSASPATQPPPYNTDIPPTSIPDTANWTPMPSATDTTLTTSIAPPPTYGWSAHPSPSRSRSKPYVPPWLHTTWRHTSSRTSWGPLPSKSQTVIGW